MVPRAGLVLVGGDKCVHVVRTADVENQDKTCTKQERALENSTVSKVIINQARVYVISPLTSNLSGHHPSSWRVAACGCEL